MFWIGGLAPLIVAACLWFALPESVKFLAFKPDRHAEFLTTVRRLRRNLYIPDNAQFVGAAAAQGNGSRIEAVFRGSFAWITPLLWVCFASALMANFFLNSWLPLIFEGSGLTAKQSGIATSLYHSGGTIGGLLVSLALGRFGFTVIALLFLCATLAIAAIGFPGLSYMAMVSAVALSGFCTLGAQFGNNAAAGLLYPTASRSSGVGWALGIGRFGSIAGPLVGGLLIGMQVPARQLFVLAALPMVAGVIASICVARLCYRRLGGVNLDEIAQSDSPRTTAKPLDEPF
jgi:AAHS family 4-hydroxybenzoate transporter-like MFS transporter